MNSQVSYRDSWTEISLDAVSHNVKAFKQHIQQGTRLMAVVKADGYGHGALEVAEEALEAGADYLAVALLDEAIALREAGISAPLLVLGYTKPEAIKAAIKYDITLTVYTMEVAERMKQVALETGQALNVHIKIDSGMHRIGIKNAEDALELARVFASSNVTVEGIFTHFADADSPDAAYTEKQFSKFMEVVRYLEDHGVAIPIKHCCNSAGTINFRHMHLDMVRVGISLYGLYPNEDMRETIHLRQVMSFKTKPVMIKTVAQGEPISYGRTFAPDEEARIATIPVGYADGFSRLLSNRGNVTINGKRMPIVGRICMDLSMIDVTEMSELSFDDTVTLFGEPEDGCIPLGEVADLMGTIHYETVTLIGKRVPRVYIKNGNVIKEKGLL